MATFLLKINPEGCPGQLSRPSTASDWENAPFLMPPLATMSSGLPQTPAVGDTVEVWVSEEPRERKAPVGRGYTGRGRVAGIVDTSIWLDQIELSNPPLEANRLLPTGGAVLAWIGAHRHPRLAFMSEAEAQELGQAILSVHASRAALIAGYQLTVQPDDVATGAANFDDLTISDAFRERIAKVRSRTSQGLFRSRVLSLYGGRCCVTGSNVPALLEAAHILPVSVHPSLHDRADNGLLLRSDIHLLFDGLLIGIDPSGYQVRLAPSLIGSEYEFLSGKAISPLANSNYLRTAFDAFLTALNHND